MEEVRKEITSILRIDDLTVNRILEKLASIGVSSVDDLVDVQFEDLSPEILLPIPARKLIRQWSASTAITPPSATSAASTPQTPSSQLVRSTPVTPTTPLSTISENERSNWPSTFDVQKFVADMKNSHESAGDRLAAQNLLSGKPLSSAQRNAVVRYITDRILAVCKKPSRCSLNTVAETLAGMFIQLKDQCDGVTIGTGYVSLRNQLEYRIAYINRPITQMKKVSILKRMRTDDEENQPSKKMPRDGYGCVNFLPIHYPEGETEESLAEKQQQMKEAYNQNEWAEGNIDSLMDITYIVQRQDLVGKTISCVADIEKEWPFLVRPKGMVQHLTKLLGFNIVQQLEEGLQRKKAVLLSFFCSKSATMKEMARLLTTFNAAGQHLIDLLTLLTTYFREDESAWIRSVQVFL